jgi:hypothetical protein
MSARRLEEAFEECVTACLEGRRSIEESLSLYPAFAAELAPLLRTAVRLSDSFQKVSPPARLQERGLQRFLADARARRRLRELTAGSRTQSWLTSFWLSSFWGQHRLGFAGAAALVAALAIAVGSATMLTSGGGGSGPVAFQPAPPSSAPATPQAVLNIQTQIGAINDKRIRGEPVTPGDLSLLSDATSKLTSAPDVQSGQVQQVLQDASSLVTNIAASQPEVAPQAQQTQNTIRDVASAFKVPIVSATPAPSGTPAATAQPTPVPTSASPTPVPTSGPTPEPTGATATATPQPTDTPVERGLPGG